MTGIRSNAPSTNPLGLAWGPQEDAQLKELLGGKDFDTMSMGDLFKTLYGVSADDALREFGFDPNNISPESLFGSPEVSTQGFGTGEATAGTAAGTTPSGLGDLSTFDNVNALLGDFDKNFANGWNANSPPLDAPDPVSPGGCLDPIKSTLEMPDPNTVTTPGGYKVHINGKSDWTITGPDGKATHIWGDPHVDEADGGKWQFKKPTTFVLGDGTRINVKTGVDPKWPDATVTTGLDIVNGQNRVKFLYMEVDGGTSCNTGVYDDGDERQWDFKTDDTVVMGADSDDWTFKGKEIVGSDAHGDHLTTGREMKPVDTRPGSPKPAAAPASAIPAPATASKPPETKPAVADKPAKKPDPTRTHGPEGWSKKLSHDVLHVARQLGLDKALGKKDWGAFEKSPWEAMGLLRHALEDDDKTHDRSEKVIRRAFDRIGDMFRVLHDQQQIKGAVGRRSHIQG